MFDIIRLTRPLIFLGGPLDLMSRRVVAANNKTIAQRLIKEIEAYPAKRDDAPVDSEWNS